jgi:AcrR family transcriptional regulator
MSDIADAVGIVKASLYSHYSGKDDLFLAVAEDFMQNFKLLSDRLYEASESMDIPDKLYYIFKEYILHYLRNPLLINFAMQSVRFVPDELIEDFFPKYEKLAEYYRQRLKDIFSEGMKQGIIRPGDSEKKVWTLLITRDGVLAWIIVEQLGEEYIEAFWNDYWFGVAEQNKK